MDSNPHPNPNPNPAPSSSLHPSNFKPSPFPAPLDTQLDLYTIPSHSCWFSWDSIHETERSELREFFDGSSFTRTPKIYKEYRDFIISKYREEPSRRLCFTEVRKSLVGDVSVLRKVFNFLDKWGLINFGASNCVKVDKEDDNVKVRVEDGAPVGIRVVNLPSSAKPLVVAPPVWLPSGGGGGENGFKLPPLASYSDVFEGLREKSGVVCGNCKEKCDSKFYECTKEKYVICFKCFEKGAYGENKSVDDFKLKDSSENSSNQGSKWTEAETLLLLESVLKHGDDWELVAQNVKTKSKLECISRLIELPIGQLMLGSQDKCSTKGINGESVVQGHKESSESQEKSDVVQEQKASSEPQEKTDENQEQKASSELQEKTDVNQEQKASSEPQEKTDENQEQKASSEPQEKTDENQEQKASSEPQEKTDVNQEQKASSEPQEKTCVNQEQKASSESQEKTDAIQVEKASSESQETNKMEDDMDKIESIEPPLKKQRLDSSDPSRSLMDQVALISSMVGPQITATAASAAVSVLSDGNSLVRDIFYAEDHALNDEHRSGNLDRELEKALDSEDSEMKDASEVDKIYAARDSIPLALRMRAAVATALGAAAAHARLLADQEEREIEHLMAFVIETQLKKLKRKAKFFEDLEHLMEKEHSVVEELKDSIIEDRMETLRTLFTAGIPRWKDHSSSKALPGGGQE